MIRSAPNCLAARIAMSPTAPSPTTTTVLPGPAWAATAANQPVPSTSEAASSDGISSGSGCPGVVTSVPSACGMRAFSAWVPIVCATNSACTHLDWKPAWQMSQVLSETTKDPTTKSPTCSVCTSSPPSSTTPTYSCPITWVVGRLHPAVGPQVRSADARRGQPDDRIGRLLDLRVRALLDADVAGGVENDSSHGAAPSQIVELSTPRNRAGRARGGPGLWGVEARPPTIGRAT